MLWIGKGKTYKCSNCGRVVSSRENFCPRCGDKYEQDTVSLTSKIRKQYCDDCELRKRLNNGKMQIVYEIGGVVCRACKVEDIIALIEDT